MRQIIVNIYEHGEILVVGHTFYGKTLKEAEGNLNAHLKTDSFFNAAIKVGNWRGIPLTYTVEEI